MNVRHLDPRFGEANPVGLVVLGLIGTFDRLARLLPDGPAEGVPGEPTPPPAPPPFESLLLGIVACHRLLADLIPPPATDPMRAGAAAPAASGPQPPLTPAETGGAKAQRWLR